MQQSLTNLTFVIGDEKILSDMRIVPPLRPFGDGVIAFMDALSKRLIKYKNFPDVATFGFWCRKAALTKEKEKYDDIANRIGRGTVFHSTPSNVPVNFAFSFATGLLAGNANIVRLPGKPFEQVDIICAEIKKLLAADFADIAPYVCFVKFSPDKAITDLLSDICDVRVVWGGDATIAEMRSSALRPRAGEITFADRHSVAVIDSDKYMEESNKDAIAVAFYNDTYYTDQNACTSPRVIFWMGSSIENAKFDFWARVHKLVESKYKLTPVQAVGKLSALCKVAANKTVHKETTPDMFITRVAIDDLTDIMKYKYNSGFFYECNIKSLAEIAQVCDIRCQTLTYYGLEKTDIVDFINKCRPRGLDRAVPMGKSMDFTLVWDGHDLIREMSRVIGLV